ncbi:hypothetical protein BJV74DRAFT_851400 [Russula compacta]|nr:hypothetical protein BJV74DRAFT_851400 [Russula compacta]
MFVSVSGPTRPLSHLHQLPQYLSTMIFHGQKLFDCALLPRLSFRLHCFSFISLQVSLLAIGHRFHLLASTSTPSYLHDHNAWPCHNRRSPRRCTSHILFLWNGLTRDTFCHCRRKGMALPTRLTTHAHGKVYRSPKHHRYHNKPFPEGCLLACMPLA